MKSTAYYAPDFCHEPHNDFRQAEYESASLLEICTFLQCDQIGILLRDLSKSFYLQK